MVTFFFKRFNTNFSSFLGLQIEKEWSYKTIFLFDAQEMIISSFII